jgi:uncharacterized protein
VTCFVDSSALIAIIDRNEQNHRQASQVWLQLLARHTLLLTTNYVLLETSSIVQRRIGIAALETLMQKLVPVLEIVWISPDLHREAVECVFTAARRQVSLVDHLSFLVMRRHGIRSAFAFDQHFIEHGFLPPVVSGP